MDCNNFQDAQAFINNKGQRGKQLAILTTGTYHINTEFFRIQRREIVKISSDEVGLVEAKYGKSLPPGRTFGKVVDCNNFQDAQAFINNGGQRGKQLAILTVGEYQINTELFEIRKVPVVEVKPNKIRLVVAQDGEQLPLNRILGRVVECNNFQDASAFLLNGGQKGRQLGILTTGKYHINTDFFTIVTADNATQYDLKPDNLKVYRVESNKVGIVTIYDGMSLPKDDFAGAIIEGHDKFQNPQKFIDLGGYTGLQEEFLEEGEWNLNPWFAKVEQVPVTHIPNGTVGVVISNVGKTPEGVNGALVEQDYKGIWKTPYSVGQYLINTRVKTIVIVPHHGITLDWTNEKQKEPTNYDANLNALEFDSNDGFEFTLDVTQLIRIAAEDAPKMISRIVSDGEEVASLVDGNNLSNENNPIPRKYNSIRNLVARVLQPTVESYFVNAANNYKALDFLEKRDEIMVAIRQNVKEALAAYGVESVNTLIKRIKLPPEINKQLNKQTLENLKQELLIEERETERRTQDLVKTQEQTKILPDLVQARGNAQIAKIEAQVRFFQGKKELDLQKQRDEQELDKKRNEYALELYKRSREDQLTIKFLKEKIELISLELYGDIEREKIWSDALKHIKEMKVPEIYIGGSSNHDGGMEAMQGNMHVMLIESLKEFMREKKSSRQISGSHTAGILDAPHKQIEPNS